MCRQPPAAERQPSQRAPRAERDEAASDAEYKRKYKQLQEEFQQYKNKTASVRTENVKLKEAVKEKEKKRNAKGKMTRTTLDRHAAAAAERWTTKYDADDIPLLAMAIVTKAAKKLKKPLHGGIKKTVLFRHTSSSPRSTTSATHRSTSTSRRRPLLRHATPAHQQCGTSRRRG